MVSNLTRDNARTEGPAIDGVSKESVAEGVRQYTTLLTSSDPKAIAIQLAMWRATNARYVDNCRAIAKLGLPVKVTGKRLGILKTLYFTPGRAMGMSELSRLILVSPAAITNYVDSLVRGNLVRRTCNPHDRHAVVVQLTARGESTFLEVAEALGEAWTAACTGFTEEEKDLLLCFLKRLS